MIKRIGFTEIFILVILLFSSCTVFYKCPVQYYELKTNLLDRFYAYLYNKKVIYIVLESQDINDKNIGIVKSFFAKRYKNSKKEINIFIYKYSDEIFDKKGGHVKFNNKFIESLNSTNVIEETRKYYITSFKINENESHVTD